MPVYVSGEMGSCKAEKGCLSVGKMVVTGFVWKARREAEGCLWRLARCWKTRLGG